MTIEARIEYVTTDDGVSLACTKFGSGPALIYQFANPSSSYFEMELAFPPAVETYEALARFATVVRYDSRNTGLSTRGVEDVSIEAHVRDLEAVRGHFGLGSMALMFPFVWARVAVEYAAANSDRIERGCRRNTLRRCTRSHCWYSTSKPALRSTEPCA